MRLSSFFCLVCSRTQWSLSAGGAKIIDACMFLNKISGICRNVNVIFLARTGTEFNETAKNFNKSNVYGCNMSALGERSVRIREVEGSNPFRSTIGRISEPCIVWGAVFVQTRRHSLPLW